MHFRAFCLACMVFSGLFCALPAAHAVGTPEEIFQILVFEWNEAEQKLEYKGRGSGTAIGSDLLLTNRHVVEVEPPSFDLTEDDRIVPIPAQMADFLLLCRGERGANQRITCDIPAMPIAANEQFDAALVKRLEGNFFPYATPSLTGRGVGDKVRIFGFPTVRDDVLNFGSTKIDESVKKWREEGGVLRVMSDNLTVTRGEILHRSVFVTKLSDGTYFEVDPTVYYATDAPIYFGNSGGAAYDEAGKFIAIPTAGNDDIGLLTPYAQIHDWVEEHRYEEADVHPASLAFYNSVRGKSTDARRSSAQHLWQQRNQTQTQDASGTTSPRSFYQRPRARGAASVRSSAVQNDSYTSPATSTSQSSEQNLPENFYDLPLRERVKILLQLKRQQ